MIGSTRELTYIAKILIICVHLPLKVDNTCIHICYMVLLKYTLYICTYTYTYTICIYYYIFYININISYVYIFKYQICKLLGISLFVNVYACTLLLNTRFECSSPHFGSSDVNSEVQTCVSVLRTFKNMNCIIFHTIAFDILVCTINRTYSKC